ncbi:MAG: 6-phosphofructokinase [Bdellovibrionaceae bacterium]|nr:6-phosphofructokinase [Pseudobdellovibrionaceae bacterium]
MKNKVLGVYTSGGDAPGMNASLRAVVRMALHYGWKVIGIEQAYKGMVEKQFKPLGLSDVAQIIQRGGTVLQSSRYPDFLNKTVREKAYNNLKEQNISSLVCIGGDGSFKGLSALHKEFNINVVGIPATIDNNIYGTDLSLGVDTASNVVLTAIDDIRNTADSHGRVFLVEVMGNNCGFLALHTALSGGAEDVFLPKDNLKSKLPKVVANIQKRKARGKKGHILVVAESPKKEGYSHQVAKQLRALAPSLDVKVFILGHMQRGGAPTCLDRSLGSRFGIRAVELLEKMYTTKNIEQWAVVLKEGKISELILDEVINQKKALEEDILSDYIHILAG